MARILPFKIDSSQQPLIGRQLFDVITAGMYDNPLMVYREYVQNAVDSIDLAIETGCLSLENARVEITIDRASRTITIEDNGSGLGNLTAHQTLMSLGCSPKESSTQRGFRGIGRLGGLAYCARLVFETRAKAGELVALVTWDRSRFDTLSQQKRLVGLDETLSAVAQCEYRPAGEDDPEHFFRVRLEEVIDFHSNDLMSHRKVQAYLSQVAPVPFDHEKFSFAEKIETKLKSLDDYRCYAVLLNDRQIMRPYADTLMISTVRTDSIQDIAHFEFKGLDGELIAIGWYAKTGFLASVPEETNMRGLKVRLGNIEVGDQHFLTRFYSEARFAAWHIGELHIVERRLKPNARRDAFEHTEHLERFSEQAQQLCRFLSGLCRKASSRRCQRDRALRLLHKLEEFSDDDVAFIDLAHHRSSFDKADKMLISAASAIRQLGAEGELSQRLEQVRASLKEKRDNPVFLDDLYDGRSVKDDDRGKKVSEVLARVSQVVMSEFEKCATPNELINAILEKYLVGSKRNNLKIASL